MAGDGASHYREGTFSFVGSAMLFYGFLGLAGLGFAWWILRSPVLRAFLRGRGTDPGQFGTWQDHLDDIGLGVSWRNDGYEGRRESRLESKHTRRRP